MTRIVPGLLLSVAAIVGGFHASVQSAPPNAAGAPQRVVIPFDFDSPFDQGRYGRKVGELIWKKLERRGGFAIPESMLDVRDWSRRRDLVPGPATSLTEMRRIVCEDFEADIGIWGKVERVAGARSDIYDMSIRIADFSGQQPRMIHQIDARTKTVSEIPHVYVKAALDQLYGQTPAGAAPPDVQADRRWLEEKNLVRGDFEQRGPEGPIGWNPLPAHVRVVPLDAGSQARNHVVRFQFPDPVAASSGVLYYSDFFPVKEGATYRFQCRWRTTGPAAKVFIKCYDELASEYQVEGSPAVSSPRREVYRSQQNLVGPRDVWNVQTEDFVPRHTQYTPRWGRVMLYANWPAGVVEWDDVIVKQVGRPNGDGKPKVRRPSLETKTLSEEIPRDH